jgi:predicted site-specific integrase-resolvase
MIKLKNQLYTTKEATKILGLASSSIVRSYLINGYLEGKKLKNGQWVVIRQSLQDKLNRQAKL